MKKFVLIGAFLFALSCGKSETESQLESNVMLEEPALSPNAEDVGKHEGLALIEGADCLTCHKTDAKLIGPSYQEVADKYTEADIDLLASKIIDGGQGVWGEIPMTPHPGMSKENAKKMVEYILTLKK